MSLFDSSAPGITVLTDVPFPATIISGPGITINKADPTAWEMSLDYALLAEDTSLTPPSNYYTAVLDTTNGNYEKIRLDHFINQIQTIDQRTGIGDTNYTVAVSDRYVALTAALTAVRNLTLPAAASVAPGHAISFQDEVGGLSNTHYWIIHTSGSDTLNGATNRILSRPYAGVRLICDGVSKWTLERTTGMAAPTTNYVMTPDDTSIGFGTLTGPVTATLPLANSVAAGKSVTVLDLLGTCSNINTITVARSGSDTINGVPAPLAATLNAPYFFITLQSDGVSRWAIVGGGTAAATTTIVSTQISDSTAIGRAVLTAANTAAAQTAIGASAVGTAVFTAASTGAAQTAIGAGTTGAAVFVAATPAAAQTALGLGTMATQAASNVNITGGTIAGTQLNSNPIIGGTIDNTVIGGSTPAPAHFSSMASPAVAITGGTSSGVTVTSGARTGGNIDGTVIGATTPAAASITSLNGGPLAGFRNMLMNGGMNIDQRYGGAGESAIGTSFFVADRWLYGGAAAGKWNSTATYSGAPVPGAGLPYCLAMNVQTSYTPAAGENFAVSQAIEGFLTHALQWGTPTAKPATLSFWIWTQAGTHSGSLCNRGSARSYPFTFTVPSAGVWTAIAVTIPGDTAGTWRTDTTAGLYVRFNLGSGANFLGPANAWAAANYVGATGSLQLVTTVGNSFQITGVQLEMGSVATPFERRPYGTEFALCQRYYQTGFQQTGGYSGGSGGGVYGSQMLTVPMVTTPTVGALTGPTYGGGITSGVAPFTLGAIANYCMSITYGTTTAAGGYTCTFYWYAQAEPS
jgi:hypothetical protein